MALRSDVFFDVARIVRGEDHADADHERKPGEHEPPVEHTRKNVDAGQRNEPAHGETDRNFTDRKIGKRRLACGIDDHYECADDADHQHSEP